MKVTCRRERDVDIVEMQGQLDFIDSDGLAAGLAEIAATDPKAVVLDMAQVAYIASQGIAHLIKFAQQVRRNGGKTRMTNLDPRVKTVFDMVNLGGIIPYTPTLEDAILALKP